MLVIFDCDGVLVDSEWISNRVLAECLTEAGLPTTTEESMQTYMGRTMAACYEIAEERLGRALPHDFGGGFRDKSFHALRSEVEATPGVLAALDAIGSLGLATCVASSGPHEKMQVTLGRAGLLPRFEGRIFSASEVERGKPHPDIFLHAARQMGAAPERCVVVEDSAPGVRAGRAAGMTVLGFAPDAEPGALARVGAREFRDMTELPGLLGGLLAGGA